MIDVLTWHRALAAALRDSEPVTDFDVQVGPFTTTLTVEIAGSVSVSVMERNGSTVAFIGAAVGDAAWDVFKVPAGTIDDVISALRSTLDNVHSQE